MQFARILVASWVLLTVSLAACGGVEDTNPEPVDDTVLEDVGQEEPAESDVEQAEPSDSGSDDAEPEVVEETQLGTRDNPVPMGEAASVGDWEMTVVSVNPDAADLVAEENQFNAAPEAGHNFVMIALTGVYTGEDSGSVFGDLGYKVLGADGNTFSTRCGVIPGDITDTGETFSGATVEGNLCFSVASDQIDGATLILEEAFSFDDVRVFYALQ